MKSLYKMMPVIKGLRDGSNWKFRWRCNSEIQYIKYYSLFPPPHARIAAEPAKSQHWDRGRKISNGALRRLFKNGCAKTSVIKDKGSCPSAGRCSETFLQVLSCGIPLYIYGRCIKISWEAALLTPARSFCLELCILATRGCQREGKNLVFDRQAAAASQGRGFPLGPFDLCPPALTQNSCIYPAFQ